MHKYLAVVVYISMVHRLVSGEQYRKTILEEPNCGEVGTFCNNFAEKDDLPILECLLSVDPGKLSSLNELCLKTIWNHTRDLISNERVKETLMPFCRTDIDKLNCNIDEKGTYLKCLTNSKDDIQSPDCINMIVRLENVAFQDYKWITNFLQHCESDISKFQCGTIDENSWGQFKTLACLQTNVDNIRDECKREVFRLSEMQSDDIKMDRQLYLNCAEDHIRYCSRFRTGSGRVLQCLMQQDPEKLLQKCKQHLLRRQKLIAQDYKISKGLMKACREDIKKTHCRKQTSVDRSIRLAQILLCLENRVRNGTKIQSDCEAELLDHRKMLMEDYRLSPEIVNGCKTEIGQHCKGLELGGKTIHCLMNLAVTKNNVLQSENGEPKIDDECLRALESLVKETDAGEDWHVDPVLRMACEPVVRTSCRGVRGGDARVMSCLMDNVGTDQMTPQCEDALMQIQYFVARDFKLDPQLYRACKADALNYCHEGGVEQENAVGPSYSPHVFACLYRVSVQDGDADGDDDSDNNNNKKDGKGIKLSRNCLIQLRRTMRQRALSVDLQPEIEEVCVEDLGRLCHDKFEKGEEMLCLQSNFEELRDDCQAAVETLTEIEAEHAELNPYIVKHCKEEMKDLCREELKNDEGDVMECLIQHKNDPKIKSNPSCRASIEHFQFISLKDVKFTYKFKVACKNIAMRLCPQARNKSDVVRCLSEQMLNATVNGIKSLVPRECKQQLKAQLLQQRENIDLDPKLRQACDQDIKDMCSDVSPGNSAVLECLKSQREKLSKECSKEIFKTKKLEMFDNTVDYALNTNCAETIEMFCPHHNKETVLECLKIYRDEKGFNKKCRKIVLSRMTEQNTNEQLNPSLQQNCGPDIKKFCKAPAVLKSNRQNSPVIMCLREQFKRSRLSSRCEKEMASILREQALNVQVNPLIRAVCQDELKTVCGGEYDDEDAGKIEECLKVALLKKKIRAPECAEEIANMIVESQADINVDPLLQKACSLDLGKFCAEVPQGGGRLIQCLKNKLDSDSSELSPVCKDMLAKRLEMYKNAENRLPENMQQLYYQMSASPAKHYLFMVILIMAFSILVIGIFCGRVTHRHRTFKNK